MCCCVLLCAVVCCSPCVPCVRTACMMSVWASSKPRLCCAVLWWSRTCQTRALVQHLSLSRRVARLSALCFPVVVCVCCLLHLSCWCWCFCSCSCSCSRSRCVVWCRCRFPLLVHSLQPDLEPMAIASNGAGAGAAQAQVRHMHALASRACAWQHESEHHCNHVSGESSFIPPCMRTC